MSGYPATPGFRRSGTSQDAATSLVGCAETMRQQVLGYLRSMGARGATLHEIAQGLDMRLQTVCGRRRELELQGCVIATAQRRLGPSGRKGIVWVAA